MDDTRDLRAQLDRLRVVRADLERRVHELEEQVQAATAMSQVPEAIVSRPDLHRTLERLVKKVAMIVQGEKCVIMLFDPESGTLSVLPPALGLSEDQVRSFRVKATDGVTGEVYRSGESVVFNDAVRDPRTLKDHVAYLGVDSGVTVPLVIKKRDEEERIVETRRIGVMHVFNKRGGQAFNSDDQRLLEMLAEQAAAVIASAQMFIKIAEEKQQLEATLQSIQSGVIVMNEKGQISLINQAARRMFGVPDNDGINRRAEEVIRDGSVLRLLNESLQREEELSEEVMLSSAGDRIYQAQTSLMTGDNGKPQNVVAIFNDITEIRNVERMKTAFVSTVSHELRTPLTSIKGFVSTLMEDRQGYYDEETRQEFYAIIDQECERLHRLISDLLNIARIEEGHALDLHLGTVDVGDLAQRVVQAHQAHTSQHTFVCQFEDGMPTIIADADRLHQIIENLVSNAIKYSPEGGTIEVKGYRDGDLFIRIDVTDQGIGVPPHNRERIFDRFHRGDEAEEGTIIGGTGIGLYLVRHLAQAHGGSVWVEWSEVGKGSTFSVRLPIAPPEPRAMRGG
jgi:two-component system phosphate regulon sensor histidine kinase PhoR